MFLHLFVIPSILFILWWKTFFWISFCRSPIYFDSIFVQRTLLTMPGRAFNWASASSAESSPCSGGRGVPVFYWYSSRRSYKQWICIWQHTAGQIGTFVLGYTRISIRETLGSIAITSVGTECLTACVGRCIMHQLQLNQSWWHRTFIGL